MDEEKAARENSQAESQEQPKARSPVVPAEPSAYPLTRDIGWASASISQVVRTVALLTTVVVLAALFLLWKVRTFVGWFVNTAAQAPEGPTEYIKGLLKQNGLGGLVQRFDAELSDLRKQLGEVVGNLFSATGQVAISAGGFLAALATALTLTFFLILGGDRYFNATVGLFAERHRPLVRRILEQAAAAVLAAGQVLAAGLRIGVGRWSDAIR